MRRFHEASVYAADQFENVIADGVLDFPECTFANVIISWATGSTKAKNILSGGTEHYVVSEPLAVALVELSNSHAEFFDMCCEISSRNIQAQAPLPEALRLFAMSVLMEWRKKPRPAYRPRKRDWLEKHFIYSVVVDVADQFDLDLTRNDASDRHSACDAVAGAMDVCGRQTKYSEIRDLMTHRDYSRLREEFSAAGRIWQRKHEFLSKKAGNLLNPDAANQQFTAVMEDVRDIYRTFPRE